MKKSKVYLSPNLGNRYYRTSTEPGKETYLVIKTVNTLFVSAGQLLSEYEVSALMRRPGFDVTIQLDRRDRPGAAWKMEYPC